MQLLCPDCRTPFAIDASAWLPPGIACPAGHRFAARDGVLESLEDLALALREPDAIAGEHCKLLVRIGS